MFVYINYYPYLCNINNAMLKEVLTRINTIDIKDYIRMKLKGLPTSVKWREVKDLIMVNGLSLEENCSLYRKSSDEVLISEPSRETLKEINKIFEYGLDC